MMSASFIPAVKPVIKAVVEFEQKGDWNQFRTLTAGVVFSVLSKADLESAIKMDVRVGKAAEALKKAIKDKVDKKELKAAKSEFSTAERARLDLVKGAIVGYAVPNEGKGFEEVNLSDEDLEILYSVPAFKSQLLSVFFTEQMEAVRKN